MIFQSLISSNIDKKINSKFNAYFGSEGYSHSVRNYYISDINLFIIYKLIN